MSSARRQLRGFTLLEMMVVIALIGLVSAIVAVSVINVYEPAREDMTRNQLVAVSAAVKTYYLKKGAFPERLEQLVEAGVLEELPLDGWSKPLSYRLENGKPVLVSGGKDRQLGTEDDLVRR